jgi:hypothetical protein
MLLISNILNQYSFLIPIAITKVITFYTFIITLGLSFFNLVKNIHVSAITVSLVSFLSIYTINKTKQYVIKIHYFSDKLTKLLEQNKVCQQLLKHPNTQKILFVYNYMKTYINDKINLCKMSYECGVHTLNERVVFTFIHKGKLTRIPIVFNNFDIRNITKIEYMLFGKSVYESNKDHIEYIKSFIDNKYRNINISPLMMGYEKVKITSLDEDFNMIESEYLSNQYIN